MVEPAIKRLWNEVELKGLAEVLKTGLDIKDRKYRFKTYKTCFKGDDAVKFMIMNGVSPSIS